MIMPKEVVQAFVRLGYNQEDIEDVNNIDNALSCVDKNTDVEIVTYALYYEEGGDDIVEVTVTPNHYLIEHSGSMIASGDCDYNIDVEDEDIALGDFIQVD